MTIKNPENSVLRININNSEKSYKSFVNISLIHIS